MSTNASNAVGSVRFYFYKLLVLQISLQSSISSAVSLVYCEDQNKRVCRIVRTQTHKPKTPNDRTAALVREKKKAYISPLQNHCSPPIQNNEFLESRLVDTGRGHPRLKSVEVGKDLVAINSGLCSSTVIKRSEPERLTITSITSTPKHVSR